MSARSITELASMLVTYSPKPGDITYKRVRSALKKTSTWNSHFYTCSEIIDVLNGYNGKLKDRIMRLDSLAKARKHLRQVPGTTDHERPTNGQLSAVRCHLNNLVIQGHAEKQRDFANAFGYRWLTTSLIKANQLQRDIAKRAEDLARKLSIALGGDGTNGVVGEVHTDNQIIIKITLKESTAIRLLKQLTRYSSK